MLGRSSIGAPSLIPGWGEPHWQGIAVELSTGWAWLVGMALQEGMLVAVQVVHQVTVAAVFGDEIDGPCRRTGSGMDSGKGLILPSMATRPIKSLGCGDTDGKMAKRAGTLQTWILSLPSVTVSYYSPRAFFCPSSQGLTTPTLVVDMKTPEMMSLRARHGASL